jgi:hypothetical protein
MMLNTNITIAITKNNKIITKNYKIFVFFSENQNSSSMYCGEWYFSLPFQKHIFLTIINNHRLNLNGYSIIQENS